MAAQSSDAPPIQDIHPENAAQADAGTHASTEVAHGGDHASGGLPQFEFQWWAGQIFWLLIIFAVLYAALSLVFLPRLRKVRDERAGTISAAVESARLVQAEAAEQAEAAKREVDDARARARASAAAAKTRVTQEAAARAASEEARVGAQISEAEAAIAKTREAAMANVGAIAADAASSMVQRLTGKAPTAAEIKGTA